MLLIWSQRAVYRPPTDRWPSGRRRTPGKCVGGEPSPGFESLSVRHYIHSMYCYCLFFSEHLKCLPPIYPPDQILTPPVSVLFAVRAGTVRWWSGDHSLSKVLSSRPPTLGFVQYPKHSSGRHHSRYVVSTA